MSRLGERTIIIAIIMPIIIVIVIVISSSFHWNYHLDHRFHTKTQHS